MEKRQARRNGIAHRAPLTSDAVALSMGGATHTVQHKQVIRGSLMTLTVAMAIVALIGMPVIRSPSDRLFGTDLVGWHYDPFAAMQRFEHPVTDLYTQPLTDFPGSGLARIVGPVAAYNWMILISFPLSALTAFWFAWYFTGTVLGSSIAALAFAFAPFHLAHAAYHPHIAQTEWIPLYFLALVATLDTPSVLRLIFLTAAAVGVTASNLYGGFVAAVLTPVVLVWYCVTHGRTSLSRAAKTSVVLVVGAAMAFGFVRYAAPSLWPVPSTVAVAREDLFRYSAKWWSYLVPPIQHPIFGAWSATVWARAGVTVGLLEQQVSVGWCLLLLAFVAVWQGIGNRRLRRDVVFLLGIGACAAVCSLSPERQIGSFTFARPSAFLYPLAPMFRSYARFGIVTELVVATLAGAGAVRLLTSASRAGIVAVIALLVGTAVDASPTPLQPWRSIWPSPGLGVIAADRAGGSIFICARWSAQAAQTLGWLLNRRVGFLGDDLDDCGEPDLPSALAAAGYAQLWVPRTESEPAWVPLLARDHGLEPLRQMDDGHLFLVKAARPAVVTRVTGGFYAREYRDGRSWRWMQQAGQWTVTNAASTRVAATIVVELSPFAVPRNLMVTLDDRDISDVAVDNGSRTYWIGPLLLEPGGHRLGFVAREPAVSPYDIDETREDRRPMTIRWREWSWRVLMH